MTIHAVPRIARALGTGQSTGTSTRCADSDVTDGDARMGFHGNAAVELRSSDTSCRVLGRTVVLTDGITGADALAAGWWTSTWQVPVLLVDGEGRVPSATRSALNSLVIDNVVVLGGTVIRFALTGDAFTLRFSLSQPATWIAGLIALLVAWGLSKHYRWAWWLGMGAAAFQLYRVGGWIVDHLSFARPPAFGPLLVAVLLLSFVVLAFPSRVRTACSR